MNLEIHQIAEWTNGIVRAAQTKHSGGYKSPESASEESIAVTGYSIDSRTISPGELFFAIRGEHFDGHDFVAAAFEAGAGAAVIAASRAAELLAHTREHTVLLVEDPLAALQALATAVRHHWGKPVVGITGSAGKTTTKEAVAAVLAARFHVLKSLGNLNNGFGLPLQLLKLQPEHDIAVIEMGMSNPGEIAALARIAAPDWAVITNVGSAHAQNFVDGIEGIARAKFELVASLPPFGTAFLNCNDPYVSRFGLQFSGLTIYFGISPCVLLDQASVAADQIKEFGADGIRFRVIAGEEEAVITLAMLGRHNASNACAAIAVGVHAGIPLAECAAALTALRPADRRGEILCMRSATLINDCYNSNPEALKSMIHALAAMQGKRKILIAGEMLELGPDSVEMHRDCGKAAAGEAIDIVVGVRGNALHIVEAARAGGAQALFFETPQLAGAWLAANLQRDDSVLLKASRGVRLEQALDALAIPDRESV